MSFFVDNSHFYHSCTILTTCILATLTRLHLVSGYRLHPFTIMAQQEVDVRIAYLRHVSPRSLEVWNI